MEETYLWFTRDPCGVICMILTHTILIFSNYTITSCVLNWATLGHWRFLIIAGFQIFAVLAAVSHLKCAFGDPGAVPLPLIQNERGFSSSTRELKHPGEPTQDQRDSNRVSDTPHDVSASRACCAQRGFLRLLGALYCPLRLFKNFIGSKRVATPSGREEEALEEGWTPPICRHCEAPKPLRAHHCSGCKRCIIRMDHHCPWINNCVGFLNQKYFMLFLVYVNMMCCFSFVVLVCRFATCMDTSSADGYEEGGKALQWSGSITNAYRSIPSQEVDYSDPPSDAESSSAAARRQWAAYQNLHLETLQPSTVGITGEQGPPRRIASVDEIASGIMYAATKDPFTRWSGLGRMPQEPTGSNSSIISETDSDDQEAPQTMYDKQLRRPPRKHFLCDVTLESAVCGTMTFMFSFIFGLFTIIMFFDQLSSILSNTTGVEALKKVKNEQKSSYQLLKEVFGGPFGCLWLFPVPVTSFQLKRFHAELQRFPGAPEQEATPQSNMLSVASVRSAYESGASSVPLATRRGRSPHSSEDGYSEGVLGGGVDPLDKMHHEMHDDAEEEQVCVNNNMHWVMDGHAQDLEESGTHSVFTSPILRQPRASYRTDDDTKDTGMGEQRWSDTPAAASLPQAAAAQSSVGISTATGKESSAIPGNSTLPPGRH